MSLPIWKLDSCHFWGIPFSSKIFVSRCYLVSRINLTHCYFQEKIILDKGESTKELGVSLDSKADKPGIYVSKVSNIVWFRPKLKCVFRCIQEPIMFFQFFSGSRVVLLFFGINSSYIWNGHVWKILLYTCMDLVITTSCVCLDRRW